jgi:methionine-rich copper-binding protein CopC
MMGRRTVVAVLVSVMTLSGVAGAHAYLESADPTPGGVHSGPLATIALVFTSPVESRFSAVEVYHLDVPDDALPVDPAESDPREVQRLEGLAAGFVGALRDGSGSPADARIEASLRESGAVRTLTLDFARPLPPGVYVVFWEVLATDGHTTRDQYTFIVAGE